MRRSIAIAALAAMAVAALAYLHIYGEPRAEKSGESFAQTMIRLSEHGTRSVELKQFGDKVCFVPEGVVYAPNYAERHFPGFRIAYEESDRSEGIWFLLVGDEKSRTVKIYAVQQTSLRWPTDEDRRSAEYVTCPDSITINTMTGVPEIHPYGLGRGSSSV